VAQPAGGPPGLSNELAGGAPIAVDSGDVGGDFEQRPVHLQLVGGGAGSGLDVASDAVQKAAGLGGPTGPAQDRGDSPAPVGEGERVVADLGGLQRPVGERPGEGVIVEFDQSSGDPGSRSSRRARSDRR